MKRDIWTAEFTMDATLPWQCPRCSVSRLRVQAGSLHEGETRESKAHDYDGWEPEHIVGRFSCLMECPHCKGDISVAGVYRVHDERFYHPDHGDGGDYVTYYRPCYFSESPHLIEIPEKTPLEVIRELEIAFRLFWVDPWACANRIRSGVEALLTAQRIQRTTGRIPANGKRKFLILHDRLVRFSAKQPALADALMAVKWLGNAGSHAAPLTADDVLDGFEIMEHALDKLYSERDERVGALTRAINRRKAPRSRRR